MYRALPLQVALSLHPAITAAMTEEAHDIASAKLNPGDYIAVSFTPSGDIDAIRFVPKAHFEQHYLPLTDEEAAKLTLPLSTAPRERRRILVLEGGSRAADDSTEV